MRGVVVDMVVSGVLLYIGLTIIGLDFAIFFAVLTALFSVVPYFGAIASGLPPVLFALTDSPGKALLVLIVYIAVQQFEGNVTIPLVMSRTVKLHPAVIAVGVVVVGQLFGFVGLIVAVPILSMIVILVEELWVKPMETPSADAGGGRPRPVRASRGDVLELDRGDDDRGDDTDHDHDLHVNPETGHPPHCDYWSLNIPGRRGSDPSLRGAKTSIAGVDLATVGLILMIAGVVGFIAGLAMADERARDRDPAASRLSP